MFLLIRKLPLLLLLFSGYYCLSQQQFKAPEAPRTFEHTKYDQIPVGEYTGIPNISIPLYTLQSDNVEVPLTLQYHAGGIKVSEEASYVGLGFNLNFGIITQTINGKDDLLPTSTTANSLNSRTKQKLIYQNSPLVSQWPITCGVFNSICATCVPSGTVENYFSNINAQPLASDFNSMFIATGPVLPHTGIGSSITNSPYGLKDNLDSTSDFGNDYEPDIFRVTFFGHSIKFMQNFDSNYDEIIVLDNKGYKVTKIGNGNNTFDWNITTPDGTQYVFSNYKKESNGSAGSGLDPEVNSYDSGFGSSSYTGKWFLTKIITIKNKIIEIKYNDYGVSVAKSYDQKFRKIKVNMQNVSGQSVFGVYKTQGLYNTPALSEATQTTFNTIRESVIYPYSIESDETKIFFTYSDRIDRESDKKLDKIIVKNAIATTVKEYTFTYDYFVSSNSGNVIRLSDNIFSPTTRLKLVSLQETGSNPYQFFYDPVVLPQKNSTALDYWGFYNGKITNPSFAPNPTQLGLTGFGNNGNDNAANINFSKACSLTEIVYPTKGKINYEYELHEYEKGADDTALPNSDGNITSVIRGYGNRIKSVTLMQDGIVAKKTSFSYSGGKSIVPFQLYYSYNVDTGYLGGCGNQSNPFCKQSLNITDFTSSNYFRPALFSSINSVGYDVVTVEEVGFSTSNGKTVSQFYNNRAIKPSPIMDYQNYLVLPARENINFVNNGQLITQSIYNNKNVKVKEINYSYLINKSNIYYASKISFFRNFYCITNSFSSGNALISVPQYLVGYYLIYDKQSLLSSQTIVDYYTTGSVTNVSNYSYDSNNQITSVIKSNPLTGVFYEERTNYATSPSSILQKNILNLPSRKSIYTNNVIKEQVNYVYEDFSNNVVLKKVDVLPSGNPDPSKTKSVFYDLYDNKGNLLQYTPEGGAPVSIIWGYDKTLPIAKIENATNSEIESALGVLFSTLDETKMNDINGLRASLPKAMVTTFTHIPLVGVSSITDSKGLITTYEYDSFNRLKFVKDYQGNLLSENQYNFKK